MSRRARRTPRCVRSSSRGSEARGLRDADGLLVIIDGGKGLHAGVEQAFGAVFATLNASLVKLQCPEVDFVCRGDGEQLILDLLQQLDDPSPVAGVTIRPHRQCVRLPRICRDSRRQKDRSSFRSKSRSPPPSFGRSQPSVFWSASSKTRSGNRMSKASRDRDHLENASHEQNGRAGNAHDNSDPRHQLRIHRIAPKGNCHAAKAYQGGDPLNPTGVHAANFARTGAHSKSAGIQTETTTVDSNTIGEYQR